jgi:hypothetical protein
MQYRPFAAIIAAALAAPAIGAAEPSTQERLERMEERIRQLEQRVQEQDAAIRDKDRRLAGMTEDEAPPPDEEGGWFRNVEVGGLLELEASYADPYEGDDESDVVVATAELGVAAQVNDWTAAEVVLLHEEDETDLEVDVAVITIAPPDGPWFLTGGQLYLPFGTYETQMVSDPLTLEVGEIRESALQAGWEANGFLATAYLFNGDNKKDGGDDNVLDNWGGALGYAMQGERLGFVATVGYINDIGDSDALQEVIAGTLGSNDVDDHVGGWHLSGTLSLAPFRVIAEYVTAVDEFEVNEVAFDGAGAQPSAFLLEAGMDFPLAGREANVAVGYQGSDEALALGLPERRLMASLSVGIMERTTLSFEWAHDTDYDRSDTAVDADGAALAGTDRDANTFTTQLAVAF